MKQPSPEPLRFGRLMLRPPQRGDAEALAPWLRQSWLDVRGLSGRAIADSPSPERWIEDGPGVHNQLLIELGTEAAGYLIYAIDGDDCVINEVAMRPDIRNLGLGSEAVFALEARALAEGCRHAVAPVPLANGLANYFWLRIGYCPRYPNSTPAVGFTLMTRDLATPPADAQESGSRTTARRSGGRSPRPSAPRRGSRSD